MYAAWASWPQHLRAAASRVYGYRVLESRAYGLKLSGFIGCGVGSLHGGCWVSG